MILVPCEFTLIVRYFIKILEEISNTYVSTLNCLIAHHV